LANDTDVDGDTLSVTGVTQGSHGTVVVNANNTVSYLSAAGYIGPDSFGYTISDGHGGSASATVSVTVIEANRPPTDCLARLVPAACVISNGAVQMVLSVDGEDVCVGLAGSATDPDGDALTFTWSVDGTNAATGAAAAVCLAPGCHDIVMTV
jgi:hypothetical protein